MSICCKRLARTPALLSVLGLSLVAAASLASDAARPEKPPTLLELGSGTSLIRVGAAPIEITIESVRAAECVMDAIEKRDPGRAQEAITRYDALIPKDNLGGDYTALQWLCRDLIATERGEKPRYDRLTSMYREFFARKDYANLKEYLQRQYGLRNFKPSDPADHRERCTLLQDYIMFMNPRREQWESSAKSLQRIALQPGQKVLDIGCGMGYYTYQMAAQVGPAGLVYAIETDESYLQFIKQQVKTERLRNVKTVLSLPDDIKVNDQADVAFICSLYHVIYGWSPEPMRRGFLESIKRALKPDGRLVIVDNLAAHGRELHSSFVDHRLVAAQLWFYGFRVEHYEELSSSRYILILKQSSPEEQLLAAAPPAANLPPATNHHLIRVTSGNSLVHIGSLDSYDITPDGTAAAKLVLEALQKKKRASALAAIERYRQIIPTENFGGEFTALQWFCEHFVASPEQREAMLQDPLVRAYYHYLADEDYALLKDYLKTKYKFLKPGEKTRLGDEPPRPIFDESLSGRQAAEAKPDAAANPAAPKTARSQAIKPQDEAADPNVGRVRRTFLEDFILFNNPKRPEWERTDRVLAQVDFKPGDKVADIGCGPGYYSFRFAKMVGEQGRIYALDIKREHLLFMEEFVKKQGIRNVITVKSTEDDLRLPEQVDAMFMCSLYHIIYGVVSEPARQTFVRNLRQSLKPNGRLIIVDNGPVEDRLLPYHGPYLAKELAISQLEHYGFKFESHYQIIPQRYLLIFRNPG